MADFRERAGRRNSPAPVRSPRHRTRSDHTVPCAIRAVGGRDSHPCSPLFVYGAATSDAYAWGTYGDYLFDTRILEGVGYTSR